MKQRKTAPWNCWTIPLLFFGAVLFAVGVIAFANATFRLDSISLRQHEVQDLGEGWFRLVDGERREVPPLPTAIQTEEGTVTIYRELPATLPADAVLCVETNYQSLRASVDGLVVYEYGMHNRTGFGQILGNIWNFVPLTDSMAGATVKLELDSPYSTARSQLSPVSLGGRSAMTLNLLARNLDVLIFCLLTFTLSLLLFAAAILLWIKKLDFARKGFLFLALFVLFSCIWTLTDSKVLQFFFDSKAVVYLVSFFSFLLLPVPFLLFLREMVRHGKRAVDYWCAAFLLLFLVDVILYISNLADIVTLLPLTHLLMLGAIVFLTVLCIRDVRHYHNMDVRSFLLGLCGFGIFSVLALLQFYLSDRADNSRFFRYGLLVLILFLTYLVMRRSAQLLNSRAEANTYRQLAYRDALTGLANRAAFNDVLARLAPKPGRAAALAVFDIDHLKQTNDALGHEVGDRLIRAAAESIQTAFHSLGRCYRIGGDEFVAVLEVAGEAEIQAALSELRRLLLERQHDFSLPLSVSHGYALCRQADDAFDPNQLFRQADAAMYRQKQGSAPRS